MNEPMTAPAPQDQEVFQRVWQRVMGDRTEPEAPPARPVGPQGDLSPEYLAALTRAMPQIGPTDATVSDLPTAGLEDAPGQPAERLRQQTQEALEVWQLYRHLARRTRGGAARTLTALAADQHRLARKLSAAYFLQSGVRYWPVEHLATPVISSYWGTLRRGHQWEQQAELTYRMSADEENDPTLCEMYNLLAEACRNHCRQLRSLMEQGYL